MWLFTTGLIISILCELKSIKDDKRYEGLFSLVYWATIIYMLFFNTGYMYSVALLISAMSVFRWALENTKFISVYDKIDKIDRVICFILLVTVLLKEFE